MRLLFLGLLLLIYSTAFAGTIHPGADQLDSYLPLLKNKRVALFANATSRIGKRHLVDVLIKNKIQVVKIFSPEHGFRCNKDEKVKSYVDKKTGLPIISLYGKKLKPTAEDLADIDIIVFDIQDVGVRFYTYISSLQKLMEAALVNNKPIIILDRPNPNGFYVDGPVLDPKHKSFTGMQPIPIVYGMTMGEYAKMLVGEEWLDVTPKTNAKNLKLTVIPCKNYTHQSLYVPPVNPSPNLPSIQSIYWYPIIGILESTPLSVGRGTSKPFQYFGHPLYRTHFTFTPRAKPWLKDPPFKDRLCHGWNLSGSPAHILKKIDHKLQIKYLIMAYRMFPDKKKFFQGSLQTNALLQQITQGLSESEIRKSWEPQLSEFKKIRQKYLIYP